MSIERSDVTVKFNAELTKLYREKKDVLHFMMQHQNKANAISKLCEQLEKAEKLFVTKAGGKMDSQRYSLLIKAGAQFFAGGALCVAKQQRLSDIDKRKIAADATYLKDSEAEINELNEEGLQEKIQVFTCKTIQ